MRMSKKIIYQDGFNHLVSSRDAADGYTICGLDFQFLDDVRVPIYSMENENARSEATSQIVDCHECIEIIMWCRGVRVAITK